MVDARSSGINRYDRRDYHMRRVRLWIQGQGRARRGTGPEENKVHDKLVRSVQADKPPMHEQDGVPGAIGVSDDEAAAETPRGSSWPRHGATSARKPNERQRQAVSGVLKGVLPRGLPRNRGTGG